MKYFLIFLFANIFFRINVGLSQTTFQRTYGYGSGSLNSSVQLTPEGGFIALTYTLPIVVVKTDANGDTIWFKSYEETNVSVQFGSAIEVVDQNGFAIIGTDFDQNRVYLLRIDADGEVMWAKSYNDSASISEGNAIKKTFDNGFILAGTNRPPSAPRTNIYLIKTNGSGSVEWSKSYSNESAIVGASDDYTYSVNQTSDSGFIVLGNSTAVGFDYLFLIKTNKFGDTLWTKNIEVQSSTFAARSLFVLSDGSYIITGYEIFLSPLGFMMKVSANGDVLWSRHYSIGDGFFGFDIKATYDGGVVVAGQLYTYSSNDRNAMLLKTDSTGLPLWSKTYTRMGDQSVQSVIQSPDSGYLLASQDDISDIYFVKTDQQGNSGCNDSTVQVTLVNITDSVVYPDILVSSPNTTAIVSNEISIPLDQIEILCSSLEIAEQKEIKVDCFPNSVSNILTIQIPDEFTNLKISLWSSEGRLISESSVFESLFQLDFSSLISGLYFVHIESDKASLVAKILKSDE